MVGACSSLYPYYVHDALIEWQLTIQTERE